MATTTNNTLASESSIKIFMGSLKNSDIIPHKLDQAVKFILELSVNLGVSTVPRLKAMHLYHQFKRYISQHEPQIVATACLSLSIKYFQEEIEFDAIIFALFSILKKPLLSVKDKRLAKMRVSLMKTENLITRTVEFCLTDKLAIEYLFYFFNDLRDLLEIKDAWDIFTELCMKLVSDFYLSKICLNYKPEKVAVAIVYTGIYTVIGGHDQFNMKSWLEGLSSSPDSEKFDIIEDLYKISLVGPKAEELIA